MYVTKEKIWFQHTQYIWHTKREKKTQGFQLSSSFTLKAELERKKKKETTILQLTLKFIIHHVYIRKEIVYYSTLYWQIHKVRKNSCSSASTRSLTYKLVCVCVSRGEKLYLQSLSQFLLGISKGERDQKFLIYVLGVLENSTHNKMYEFSTFINYFDVHVIMDYF